MNRVVLMLALLMLGCEEPEPALPVETFVDVLVAVRQAAREAGSPEAFAARRDAILQEAGVTEAELQAFVEEGVHDPKRLADAWDSAATRLRAPAEGAEEQ